MPEIDIWRAASLMLERYGEKALEKNTARADEPAADGYPNGAAPWHRISDAVGQLANKTPLGSVQCSGGEGTPPQFYRGRWSA